MRWAEEKQKYCAQGIYSLPIRHIHLYSYGDKQLNSDEQSLICEYIITKSDVDVNGK